MLYNTNSPPRLFATPFQFKSPPRKNKNGEGAKGEGGTPRLCEALGGMVRVTTESERTIQSEATTHAERAISHQSDYCENMFELFLTNTANLDTLRNFWNRGARFARHVGIRRGGQRIFSEWQKARERVGGGSMMSTSFKTKFCEPTGDNFKAIESIAFPFSI